MGGIYPGGGFPAQYSQGGTVPPAVLTQPTQFVRVDSRERFTKVERVPRFTPVDKP